MLAGWVLGVCFVGLSLGASFDYDYAGEHGPLAWGDETAACASTKRQSPIDLTPWDAKVYLSMPDLALSGYDVSLAKQKLKNNGHSVAAEMDPALVKGSSIGMSGADFSSEGYSLHSFHFHWAGENHKGSEHTMGGLAYPLELHMVHVRGDLGSLGDALPLGDGLAVLGVFFKLVPDHLPNQSRRPLPLDPVVEGLGGAAAKGGNGTMGSFKLSDLLPSDRQSFYRYEGSLTTPPCSEAVVWTVLAEPVLVSQAQLDAFRKVQLPRVEGGLDTANFRPVQPRSGRTLYLRSPSIQVHDAAASADRPLVPPPARGGIREERKRKPITGGFVSRPIRRKSNTPKRAQVVRPRTKGRSVAKPRGPKPQKAKARARQPVKARGGRSKGPRKSKAPVKAKGPGRRGTDFARKCPNKHFLCDWWAKKGECEENKFWMVPNCRDSCGCCDEDDCPLAPAELPCPDGHNWCPFWASKGECGKNAKWMRANCRGSCDSCRAGEAPALKLAQSPGQRDEDFKDFLEAETEQEWQQLLAAKHKLRRIQKTRRTLARIEKVLMKRNLRTFRKLKEMKDRN